MTTKKLVLTVTTLLLAIGLMMGCSKKETDTNRASQTGGKITSKDVVSQKDVVVDGEEMTEYTLGDGENKIVLPKGVDIDEAGIELPSEDELKNTPVENEYESLNDSSTADSSESSSN